MSTNAHTGKEVTYVMAPDAQLYILPITL